jgi:hypothetical protein
MGNTLKRSQWVWISIIIVVTGYLLELCYGVQKLRECRARACPSRK